MSDPVIRRALLSVSDKDGLVPFARFLSARGVALLSTGGTWRSLAEAGMEVTEVADFTGFPEMLDGRVKTLHPKIHGGILGRRDLETHQQQMAAQGIAPIDLVVVNLYPFERTVASGADFQTVIENIDIGGPALLRSAAKNHASVTVVTEAQDYDAVMQAMESHGGAVPEALRRRLAATAYARTAAYDAAISGWFTLENGEAYPRRIAFSGDLAETLRYGENPHQSAAFYRSGEVRPGVASARQLQGKALSFNNLNDTDAAYELVAEFARPAIAIIKHANPCGVAEADDLTAAYALARRCDPVSAFGGIIAANRPVDAALAEAVTDLFAEVVIAPEILPEARELFASKKNLRVLAAGGLPDPAARGRMIRSLAGGLLVQDRDNGRVSADQLKTVTKRAPSDQELADLLFAFRVAKHVKSNTIVYARDGATAGIGAGQMSRVDAARIAAHKAGDAGAAAGLGAPLTAGSVAASDAFFPFADGLETVIEAGATAVIQPGGSMRDAEVIAAADKAGIAMVFTGMRHFRH